MYFVARSPAPEEMLTIEPPPRSVIGATAARMPRNTPVWLTAITWSQSASVWFSSRAVKPMPALLTSTSRPPKRSMVKAIADAHSSSLDTSRWVNTARSPIEAATASPLSTRTSPITTSAPSAANRRASASPCPRDPPVIERHLAVQSSHGSIVAGRPAGRAVGRPSRTPVDAPVPEQRAHGVRAPGP